jgi:hypothetical protein
MDFIWRFRESKIGSLEDAQITIAAINAAALDLRASNLCLFAIIILLVL